MKIKSILFILMCLLTVHLYGQTYSVVSVNPDYAVPGQSNNLELFLNKPLATTDSVINADLWLFSPGMISDTVLVSTNIEILDSILHVNFVVPNGNFDKNATLFLYVKTTNSYDSVFYYNSLIIGSEISNITPSICMVSVDSANKYFIAWDKPSTTTVDSVNIYKETTVFNKYIKIGERAFDAAPIFEDTSSNPTQNAASYEISFVNTSGIESALTNPVKSIRLNLNNVSGAEADLSWLSYEGGLTYYIYRGSSVQNMEKIGEIASDLYSFVDIAPPAGDLFYQVALVRSGPCNIGNASSDTTSLVKSNIVEYSNTGPVITSVNEQDQEKGLRIYPNPVRNVLNLHILDNTMHATASLYDMTGRLVYGPEIITGNATLDISSLTSGTYLLKIRNDNTVFSRVIIKK